MVELLHDMAFIWARYATIIFGWLFSQNNAGQTCHSMDVRTFACYRLEKSGVIIVSGDDSYHRVDGKEVAKTIDRNVSNISKSRYNKTCVAILQ